MLMRQFVHSLCLSQLKCNSSVPQLKHVRRDTMHSAVSESSASGAGVPVGARGQMGQGTRTTELSQVRVRGRGDPASPNRVFRL